MNSRIIVNQPECISIFPNHREIHILLILEFMVPFNKG